MFKAHRSRKAEVENVLVEAKNVRFKTYIK